MAYIKMWRADTYYRSIEIADVEERAPVGSWLMPTVGGGEYAYFKTKEEAIDALIIALSEEIKDIQRSVANLCKDE